MPSVKLTATKLISCWHFSTGSIKLLVLVGGVRQLTNTLAPNHLHRRNSVLPKTYPIYMAIKGKMKTNFGFTIILHCSIQKLRHKIFNSNRIHNRKFPATTGEEIRENFIKSLRNTSDTFKAKKNV